jgi:hypothetical protein
MFIKNHQTHFCLLFFVDCVCRRVEGLGAKNPMLPPGDDMLWLANGQLTAMVQEQEKHIDDMSTVMSQLMKNTKDLETLCKAQDSLIDELKYSNARLQAENNYMQDTQLPLMP